MGDLIEVELMKGSKGNTYHLLLTANGTVSQNKFLTKNDNFSGHNKYICKKNILMVLLIIYYKLRKYLESTAIYFFSELGGEIMTS